METRIETIGDRIKASRLELNMTQTELADMAGISRYTLVRYENGQQEPCATTLGAIAQALKVTTDYLIYGVKLENVWEGEILDELSKIKDLKLRRMALKQLRCILEL